MKMRRLSSTAAAPAAAALLAPLLLAGASSGKDHRAGADAPRTVRLTVRVRHTFAGTPLRLGDAVYRTPAGDRITVTRLAYLISGVTLLRPDGSGVPLGAQYAYLNPAEGRGGRPPFRAERLSRP